MTLSQPHPGRMLRATVTFPRRTLRRGLRVLHDLHREQVHAQEMLCQAARALPAAKTGPLQWVLTLEGYQLAGSHLPDPGGLASSRRTKP